MHRKDFLNFNGIEIQTINNLGFINLHLKDLIEQLITYSLGAKRENPATAGDGNSPDHVSIRKIKNNHQQEVTPSTKKMKVATGGNDGDYHTPAINHPSTPEKSDEKKEATTAICSPSFTGDLSFDTTNSRVSMNSAGSKSN